MTNTLKSEFRKLFSVRSTYWIIGIVLLLVALLAGYGGGYRATNPSSNLFNDSLLNVTTTFSLFIAVVGVLLMAHEYRYNTIIYTLTNSNSRTKVLLAKIVSMLAFAALFTLLVVGTAFASIAIGAQLGGHPLPPQEINYGIFLLKAYFFLASYALIGLLFATLIRNLVASIVLLFIVPNLVETIANLLLKKNSVYMPFSALNQVIVTVPPDNTVGPFDFGTLTPLKGAIVFIIWLSAGWLVTWLLFLRRDAT